ncbi:hypothetical protein Tdes44962_MAKER03460 [Teratosphaeria destructans]|uniref:Uncharacterized protein n=1 Tax=Teratosphaeria destructans TaxID=418781 RepID=A0A9W7SQ29_9PEZI|nr:hypothetical protein Tdes44962_MAKER03460 [Teratosphaeria destructans]
MAKLATRLSSASTEKSGTPTENSSISSEKSSASTANRQAPGTKRAKGIQDLRRATAKLGNQTIDKIRKVIYKVSYFGSVPAPEDRVFRGGFRNDSQTFGMFVEDLDPVVEAIRIQQNFTRRFGCEECPILVEALREVNQRRELGQQNGAKRGDAKPNSKSAEQAEVEWSIGDDKLLLVDDQLPTENCELQNGVSKACLLNRSWEILKEDEEDHTPFTLRDTPFSASTASRRDGSVWTEGRPTSSTIPKASSFGSAAEHVPQAWLRAPTPPPRSRTSGSNSSLAHVATQFEAEWKAKTTLASHISTSSRPTTGVDSVVDMTPEQYSPARASWRTCRPKSDD